MVNAERVRIERARRHWTLTELSARSGISRATLRRIETSGTKNLDLAMRMAQAMNIPVSVLIPECDPGLMTSPN